MQYESETYLPPEIVEKFKAEAPILTDAEIEQACNAATEATRKGQWPEWLSQVGPTLVKLGKLAFTIASCLVLCCMVMGCFKTPPEVANVHDLGDRALAHAIGNLDRREQGWTEQVRESERRDILGKFGRDIERVRSNESLDRVKAVDEVLKLVVLRDQNAASLEAKLDEVAKSWQVTRSELLQVVKLRAIERQWLDRKTVEPQDVKAMLEFAVSAMEKKGK